MNSKVIVGIVGGVAVAVVGAGILFAGSGTEGRATAGTKPLELAAEKCNLGTNGVLGDNGRSITVNGEGEEDYLGAMPEQIECFLKEVHISDSVKAEMWSTRALDGRQSGEWDGFKASWKYHPDSGLDIVVSSK